MPYVDIVGVSTYYEVTGAGRPVVLLHGAFSGADAWIAQVPALAAAGYTVWVPERRGHAHTADTSEPFSYADMAVETTAFLDTVVGRRASLIGWSDGAVVAALVAMHRPDLVDRLVLIGQYYDLSGQATPTLGAELLAMRDDPPNALRTNYDAVSPDGPDHFPVVFAKTVEMLISEPTIPWSELARISAPTLVLQGDQDEVLLEHSAGVVATIPDARLAVLPGTHALPLERPALVNMLLLEFLAGGPQGINWKDLLGV